MPQERKDFPVLFPVMDVSNHNPKAEVEWSFDPGRFSLTTLSAIPANGQVYNNYGPKSNAELLMGYGFCVVDNPYDTVLETLKPPPEALQSLMRNSHPGYFKTSGEWNSEAATFALTHPGINQDLLPASIWELSLIHI